MILNEIVEELARAEGADYFGVADLSSAHDFIQKQGGEYVASFPRAISLGIVMLDSIIDQLPQGFEREVSVIYRHHYDITNLRLDIVASKLASMLSKKGYRALPIPASARVDDENLSSIFSHKLAAYLSGLGWIGKSCLLITPEVGPRVRWVTVLTNAPLSSSGEPMKDICGNCRECVDVCPVGAFSGRKFHINESRETRYDAKKCEKYLLDLEETTGLATCGLCIWCCPKRE